MAGAFWAYKRTAHSSRAALQSTPNLSEHLIVKQTLAGRTGHFIHTNCLSPVLPNQMAQPWQLIHITFDLLAISRLQRRRQAVPLVHSGAHQKQIAYGTFFTGRSPEQTNNEQMCALCESLVDQQKALFMRVGCQKDSKRRHGP